MRHASMVLAAAFILLISALSTPGHAQQPRIKAAPPPSPVAVVLQTSDINTVEAQIAHDVSRALSETPVRVIPLIGQGAIQGVNDLLQLRYIDAAIIQSDVLAQFKVSQRIPAIENKLQYIATLYSQEIHVLSRMQFTCLADLNGRKVSFGTDTGGAAMTAEAVFSAHNVNVQPLYLHTDVSIQKLKSGEIDAIVFVGAAGARAFDAIKYSDRVHFLDVDYIEPLQAGYLPGILTHENYPDLIARDETISTISVGAVLTMAGHRSNSDQFRRLAAFVDQFFAKAETLKSGGFHGKWRELNIETPLEGWTRFPAAQAWLELRASRAQKPAVAVNAAASRSSLAAPGTIPPGAVKSLTDQFLATQTDASRAEREELFNRFVNWYEQQKRP